MVLHSTTTFFAICYFEQVLSKSYLYKGSFILNYRYIMKKEIKNFNPFFMQSSYVKTYKFRVNQECTKGLLTMSTYYSVPETNILSLLLWLQRQSRKYWTIRVGDSEFAGAQPRIIFAPSNMLSIYYFPDHVVLINFTDFNVLTIPFSWN